MPPIFTFTKMLLSKVIRRFQTTMAAPKLRVLISGAGIAGPCLAYWLARTSLNVAVTVVERSPTPRVTGQSIDVRGPAVEIVKRMKLEEELRARHTTEEGAVFIKSSGKPFARFDAGDNFTADYEILRADLSQIFLDVTKDLSNVQYRYGDSIKSLNQAEKVVDVTFTGGSKETFDVVVATDGSTSKTRSMILEDHILKGSYKPIGQYIAYFSIPKQSNDPKLWQWYNTPKGLGMMIRPHRNNSTVGVYLCKTLPAKGQHDPTIEEALNEGTEASKRLLRKYFEHEGWQAKRILDGMDQAEDFYMTRAAQVKLPKWTNGRALVAGDAAFATFGVGTSLAIECAYVLAGELSKIRSTEDVPHALEEYERVFRTLYSKMEDLPRGFPQIAFPQTAWGLWLRDASLWFVSRSRLYKLLLGDEAVDWKLPDYNWRKIEEMKA